MEALKHLFVGDPIATSLVIAFKAHEQAMLPLYALGVFLSFTLSQAGMVIHWLRERKPEDVKNRSHTEALLQEWEKWRMGIPIKVVKSPYRSLITVLLKYITDESRQA